jgi:serine/threonine protein kinase
MYGVQQEQVHASLRAIASRYMSMEESETLNDAVALGCSFPQTTNGTSKVTEAIVDIGLTWRDERVRQRVHLAPPLHGTFGVTIMRVAPETVLERASSAKEQQSLRYQIICTMKKSKKKPPKELSNEENRVIGTAWVQKVQPLLTTPFWQLMQCRHLLAGPLAQARELLEAVDEATELFKQLGLEDSNSKQSTGKNKNSGRSVGVKMPIFPSKEQLCKHFRWMEEIDLRTWLRQRWLEQQAKDSERAVPPLMWLLDTVKYNGFFVCMVLPPVRITLADVLTSCREQRGSGGAWYGLPLMIVRRIALQLLRALEFLHSQGVVHADVRPANIFLPKLSSDKAVKKFLDDCENLDNNPEKLSSTMARAQLMLGGFDVAFWTNSKACKGANKSGGIEEVVREPRVAGDELQLQSHGSDNGERPLHYHAPEVLLQWFSSYSMGIDMWAAGSTLAELIVGAPLLPGTSMHSQMEKTVELLGMPPPSVLEEPIKLHKEESGCGLCYKLRDSHFVMKLRGMLYHEAPRTRERNLHPKKIRQAISAGLNVDLIQQRVWSTCLCWWFPLEIDGTHGFTACSACFIGVGSKKAPANGAGKDVNGNGVSALLMHAHPGLTPPAASLKVGATAWEEFDELILHLLAYEPAQRPSATQLLSGPFLSSQPGS